DRARRVTRRPPGAAGHRRGGVGRGTGAGGGARPLRPPSRRPGGPAVTEAPRVLVTRPRAQASDLVRALETWGARPVLFPTVEIRAPVDATSMDGAVVRLRDYHWLVFTSANAVPGVFDRLGAAPAADLGLRIAALGPATAAEIRRRGARVDFVPSEYLGAQLGRELPDVEGRTVLLPQGDQAGSDIVEALIRRGARVDVVEAY